MDGRQPEDSFTQDLSKAVESAKRNEKCRLNYMTLQMAYDEKYREGIIQEKEDTAYRMLFLR